MVSKPGSPVLSWRPHDFCGQGSRSCCNWHKKCSWLRRCSFFAAGELPAAVAAAAGAAARKRRRVVNFGWVSFFLVVAALVSVNQAEAACTAAVMHCHCWLRFHGLTRLWKGCVLVRHSVRTEPLYLIECVGSKCVWVLFFVLYYLFVFFIFLTVLLSFILSVV